MSNLRISDLAQSKDPKWIREIVTPEGIPLRFTLARSGERAGAFAIDFFLQLVVIGLLAVLLEMAVGGQGTWLTAVVTVLTFLCTTFYFVLFEVRWQGATPGKKGVKIRVIDARGGQLETRAIIARNLVRELELWMPLRFLILRDVVWKNAPWWATLFAVLWTVVFLFFPLFNKDRLRIGDLIAGTMVVERPNVVMVPDLADARRVSNFGIPAAPAPAAAHVFTDAQLGHYGIYELQILEGVLRSDAGNMSHFHALETVATKVAAKIGYTEPVRDNERFLRDFYAAQRAHLEHKMVLGQRRENKFSARK